MSQKSNPSAPLFERFLHSQSAGSFALLLATIAAVVWANSPWSAIYHSLSHLDIGTYIGGNQYHLTLAHWVKDGLMTIFFFVVGLEIKREILIGELSSPRKALLPVAAAIGGATVPALLFLFFNQEGPASAGWGVPMATDIAFAIGVLTLFGNRVPTSLKVFLTALAIVDDLMAVLVIAFFYTEQIAFIPLAGAVLFLVLLGIAIRYSVRRPGVHLLLFLGVWSCILLSGVHATIAGVLVAFLYPIKANIEPEKFYEIINSHISKLKTTNLTRESMVDDKTQLQTINQIYLTAEDMIPAGIFLEQNLHSIQAFLILPLFALFSAGVVINMETFQGFPSSLSLGIILGLTLGKQIGILGVSYLVVKSKLAELGNAMTWGQLWGISIVSGIGFTMSIFISELAFADQDMIADAKVAIFIASILAALLGYLVLHKTLPRKTRQ